MLAVNSRNKENNCAIDKGGGIIHLCTLTRKQWAYTADTQEMRGRVDLLQASAEKSSLVTRTLAKQIGFFAGIAFSLALWS